MIRLFSSFYMRLILNAFFSLSYKKEPRVTEIGIFSAIISTWYQSQACFSTHLGIWLINGRHSWQTEKPSFNSIGHDVIWQAKWMRSVIFFMPCMLQKGTSEVGGAGWGWTASQCTGSVRLNRAAFYRILNHMGIGPSWELKNRKAALTIRNITQTHGGLKMRQFLLWYLQLRWGQELLLRWYVRGLVWGWTQLLGSGFKMWLRLRLRQMRGTKFRSWNVLLNKPHTYPVHLLLARSLLHMLFIM